MLLNTILTLLAGASAVSAAALPHAFTRSADTSASPAPKQIRTSNGQQAVYWGQNSAERDLSAYCASTEGIDIIVLAFVYTYGGGQVPVGNFGNGCSTLWNCTDLASDVQTCQAAGKKVFVSVGGAASTSQVSSQSDGESIGQMLWDQYANPAYAVNTTIHRPLGDVAVDGFDLDIEWNPGNDDNYKYVVQTLRSNFAKDSSKSYFISGAPQCPIPEPNMGQMIMDAKFDYLFIQFYNNPGCSANNYFDGNQGDFNFDAWNTFVSSTASSGASLFIGLPASTLGATGTDSGAKYYLAPSQLATLVGAFKSHAGFGGVMLWDGANSDKLDDNGCHYAGEVASILSTGNTC